MSLNHHLPKKFDPIPKKHHYFQFFLFICGCLLPPIAVAARFGVGHDLFINIICTLCGYFPGHGHNFYVQNIRNNENKARTPKWVRKAGLVDPAEENRRIAKSQWKKRYDERNNISTHVGAELEEGEEGGNYAPIDPREEERRARLRNEGLWTGDDETYYNEDAAPNQRHHHYPMNFEGTDEDAPRRNTTGGARRQTSGGGGGERDPITGALIGGNAYSNGNGNGNGYSEDHDVPEWGKDYGSKARGSAKKSRNPLKRNKKSTEGMGDVAYNNSNGGGGYGRGGYDDLDERRGGGGGGYRDDAGYGGSNGRVAASGGQGQATKKKNADPFDHEF